MNTIKHTHQKWKRLLNFPVIATLSLGVIFLGCNEDTPDGPDVTDAPEVVSTTPEDNAEDVEVNAEISATFSEDMSEASIHDSSFYLMENGMPVSGTVTLSGRTATLTPNFDLNSDTEYIATVTTEVESAGNVQMDDDYEWSFTTGASVDTTDTTDASVQDTLNFGSTGRFAVLSRNGIVHTGDSEINGDIGISPGASTDISGFDLTVDSTGDFSTATGVNGNIYASDYSGGTPDMLVQAEEDIITAYDNSMDTTRGTANELNGDLNGQTLTPGLYEGEALELSENGVLTLDAEGNSDAVFLFRSTSTLATGSGSEVMLTGDAQPQNVYWVAETDVSLGENSINSGTYISGGDIDMLSGSDLNGRLMLQGENGNAVNLNGNTITVPNAGTAENL